MLNIDWTTVCVVGSKTMTIFVAYKINNFYQNIKILFHKFTPPPFDISTIQVYISKKASDAPNVRNNLLE